MAIKISEKQLKNAIDYYCDIPEFIVKYERFFIFKTLKKNCYRKAITFQFSKIN